MLITHTNLRKRGTNPPPKTPKNIIKQGVCNVPRSNNTNNPKKGHFMLKTSKKDQNLYEIKNNFKKGSKPYENNIKILKKD